MGKYTALFLLFLVPLALFAGDASRCVKFFFSSLPLLTFGLAESLASYLC